MRVPMIRMVDPQWHCQRSGDCCTLPKEVVMTQQEAAALILHAPSEIELSFRPHDMPGFMALKARPCPLYQAATRTCAVYEVRPYNCRRFGCMRPNVETEPFDGDRNMMDRVNTDKSAFDIAVKMQADAQPWATTHGWFPNG